MPRKMFRAREHTLRLTRIDPRRGVFSHAVRVAAERACSDDRVVRLDVDVAIGRIDPVDSERSRFDRTYRCRATNRLYVFEQGDGGEWRKRGLTRELLSGASLQVRADQQRNARLRVEILRERGNVLRGPPEEDEPADAQTERLIDRG